ncbi:MAG: zinc metallopeptidase [Planctomycetaceae bacterium]|nr:zinc metallopeptidase [Planctomycetaceae bacterium]
MNPSFLLFVAPALILMVWAQSRVHSAFARGSRIPAPLSGAQAARLLLDRSGCPHVEIEMTHGHLTDHYDPRAKVLRLSEQVYHESSLSAVGIAAHEAGHAIQDAQRYAPLAIRNGAVPAAQYGPMVAMVLFLMGAIFAQTGPFGIMLLIAGLVCFSGVVVFQLINLPVEFDASARAKQLLSVHGIVDERGAAVVRDVLNAAAWTYVAATLQSILQMAYFAFQIFGRGSGNR